MGHDIVLKVGKEVVARFYISGNWSNHSPSIYDLHGHSGRVIAAFLKEKLKEMIDRGIFPRTGLNVDGYGNYKDDKEARYQGAVDRTGENGEIYFDAWQDYRDGTDESIDIFKRLHLKKIVFAIDCMHAYIMSEIVLLALKHPDAYWYSDQAWEINELNGDKGLADVDDSADDSSDDYEDW